MISGSIQRQQRRPAPEKYTHAFYQRSLTIDSYKIAENGRHRSRHDRSTQIDGIKNHDHRPVSDYAELMRSIFDFNLLKQSIGSGYITLRFDAMHAINRPYAKEF